MIQICYIFLKVTISDYMVNIQAIYREFLFFCLFPVSIVYFTEFVIIYPVANTTYNASE